MYTISLINNAYFAVMAQYSKNCYRNIIVVIELPSNCHACYFLNTTKN